MTRTKHLQSGNSLIGILVALVVIVGLTLVFVFGGFGLTGNKSERKDKVGTTIIGKSMARAKDAKCMEYLKQVRMSIEMNTNTDDEKPESMDILKLPTEVTQCPIGKEPYVYDPATGKVSCPHLGHEKY